MLLRFWLLVSVSPFKAFSNFFSSSLQNISPLGDKCLPRTFQHAWYALSATGGRKTDRTGSVHKKWDEIEMFPTCAFCCSLCCSHFDGTYTDVTKQNNSELPEVNLIIGRVFKIEGSLRIDVNFARQIKSCFATYVRVSNRKKVNSNDLSVSIPFFASASTVFSWCPQIDESKWLM